jgi:hypothetical protein
MLKRLICTIFHRGQWGRGAGIEAKTITMRCDKCRLYHVVEKE